MKIAFYGLTDQWKKQFYQENLREHQLSFFDACLSETEVSTQVDYEVLSIFVACRITPKIIDNMPNLKLIAVRATGFDNVDIEYAKQKGIKVVNVPAYGSHTVAEFTFALLLSLTRRLPEAIKKVKEEGEFDYQGLRGSDLFSKTLGVIGTGKIGINVIRIAKGFGMNVLGFDAFPNHGLAQQLNFEYVNLDQLLESSDVVSIHTPYNKDTHHLLNKENIFKIKKGALLINTARGPIIETDALYQAVMKNHLAGVAVDVLEEENLLKNEEEQLLESSGQTQSYKGLLQDHVLIEKPNVIITPHMAFFTKEAEEAIQKTTVENINTFISGNPQNVVN